MSQTPIDYTDPAQQVRLLIADVSTDPAKRLLDDDQVTGYLAMNDGHVRRAAADALDAIATSETLVSKKIRTQDLSTDGPAVATALRAQATQLRQLANDEDDVDLFDVVDTLPTSGRPEHTNPDDLWPTWGL